VTSARVGLALRACVHNNYVMMNFDSTGMYTRWLTWMPEPRIIGLVESMELFYEVSFAG